MVYNMRLAFVASLLALAICSPLEPAARDENIVCEPYDLNCPVEPHPTGIIIGRNPEPRASAPTSSATAPIFYCDADPCYEGEVCCWPHGCFPASEGCPASYVAPRAEDIVAQPAVNISCDGEICDASKYTCCPPHGCCPKKANKAREALPVALPIAEPVLDTRTISCDGETCPNGDLCCPPHGCFSRSQGCPEPALDTRTISCDGETCPNGDLCCPPHGCFPRSQGCPKQAALKPREDPPSKRELTPKPTISPGVQCGLEICPAGYTCCGVQYGCQKSKFCPL